MHQNAWLTIHTFSLTPASQSVEGINAGLDIAGKGTFIFDVEDDDGGLHIVKIPDSLFVPGVFLMHCTLFSQYEHSYFLFGRIN